MKTNLCIRDLVEITGGRLKLGAMPPLGGEFEPLGRVVVDCRQVRPGDVFWALERESLAGMPEEAFARSALGVVTAGRRVEPWAGKFAIQVDDSRAALRQLVRAVRSRFQGFMVAVAGHTGKTSTARWIEWVLRARGIGYRADATFSPAFDPRTLLELTPEHRYGLFEISDEVREPFAEQARWVSPHAVVVASADAEADLQAAAAVWRSRLQDCRDALPIEGTIVVNGDDERLTRALPRFSPQVLRVGRGTRCDWSASHIQLTQGWLQFVVEGTQVRVPAAGRHLLFPALAAFAVGRLAGISAEEIARRLEDAPALDHVCRRLDCDGLTLLVDACRARPQAAAASLAALRDAPVMGRRVVLAGPIFGESVEACRWGQRFSRDAVTLHGADILVGYGDGAESRAQAAREVGLAAERTLAAETPEQALRWLTGVLREGDAILVAGESSDVAHRNAEYIRSHW